MTEQKIPKNIESVTFDDNNEIHSIDNEPAIVSKLGSKMWFDHGKLHRLNGPSCVFANGNKEFWIAGQQVTEIVTKYAEEWSVDIDTMDESDYNFMWLKLGLNYDTSGKPKFESQ